MDRNPERGRDDRGGYQDRRGGFPDRRGGDRDNRDNRDNRGRDNRGRDEGGGHYGGGGGHYGGGGGHYGGGGGGGRGHSRGRGDRGDRGRGERGGGGYGNRPQVSRVAPGNPVPLYANYFRMTTVNSGMIYLYNINWGPNVQANDFDVKKRIYRSLKNELSRILGTYAVPL